jgi:hypothetical protein
MKMFVHLDPTLLSVENLARAAVILAVGLLLLVSSIISIIVLISNRSLHDCIGYFLISLASADLICAIFIIPLSMYSSLSPEWHFFEKDSSICKITAYLQVVVLVATIYTFAWVSVDRYSAFMKPSRYESDHTLTRCKCWIAFSWATAILISCPIIITKMEVCFEKFIQEKIINFRSIIIQNLNFAFLIGVPLLHIVLLLAFL